MGCAVLFYGDSTGLAESVHWLLKFLPPHHEVSFTFAYSIEHMNEIAKCYHKEKVFKVHLYPKLFEDIPPGFDFAIDTTFKNTIREGARQLYLKMTSKNPALCT